MSEFERDLSKYAELIVKIGANVQKGQDVYVSSQIEGAALARLVVEHAYRAGAANVIVDWADDTLTRLKYDHAEAQAFTQFPEWEKQRRNEVVERNGCFIFLNSSNPDLLSGVDPKKIGSYQKAAGEALAVYRQATASDKIAWTIAASATKAWAAKVFPGESAETSLRKLWQAIFDAVRLHAEDPVDNWRAHDASLQARAAWMNEQRFAKLRYRAPGTDLTIGLPERHLWMTAGGTKPDGVGFMKNMPTEEVFTVPHRDGASGYVSSSKPLSYSGTLIDRFKLTFENGRIIGVEAAEGEEILKQIVETDEGSHYLGEVALVPHRSPISNANILFYNTLYDENASNHLAIGLGFPFTIEGGKTMSPDELRAAGVNASVVHVDFMIGSADMDIDGILSDGRTVPVFRGGNWAN
ncbi:aminopeptidase [Cohnella sp. JJ-181]|uniref:aminopeptidase n=1 Tax=Cohnella rhizoplanae TaxID=2974897 RepID=UPI0022FFAA77|nr:aminopeptidase [Cohnella sp. JJ-181]CAI6019353.1 Aminopeptidase 2 [Cohnella sp. JJ-181]